MINFTYLELKDRPQFKDQRFDLNRKGISLILGHNAKTKSPNGVGKSYFFGELSEFLAGEAVRQDRVRKGSVAFGVKVGKDEYEFKRSFAPRESILVTENGKPLEMDLEPARAFMRKIVPYGEQEVGSFLYLDLANGAHPLITGTTSSRKAFFREFFSQIEYLGVVRKWVENEASRISVEAKRASDLRVEMERFQDLPEPDDLRKEVATLRERRDSFSEKLSQVTAAAALIQRIKDMKEIDFGEAPTLTEEWESVANALKQVKTRRRALNAMLEEAEEYRNWEETNAELDSEIQALTEQVESHPDNGTEDLDSALAELQEKLESLNKTKSERSSQLTKLERAVQRLEEEITEGKARVKKAKRQQGVCPVCGGDYEDKHLAETIASLQKELDSDEEELVTTRTQLEELQATPEPSAKQIRRLESNIESTEQLIELRKKLKRLQKRAESKPPKPSHSVKKMTRALEQVNKQIEDLQVFDEYMQLNVKLNEFPKEIRALARSNDLQEEFVKMNDELNEKQIQLNSLEKDIELRDEMQAELEGLRETIRMKKYVDILVQAFSRKGAEKEMITMACSMLAEQVNRYAKYVFTEDFTFSFELESNFSILVHRNYGKKTPSVSDVRRLSGAEKRLFSLVLVVALLSFVPPKQRPNILILDEPTATMGQDNKEAFVRFLPVLNKVIPHLIVITPLEPHDYAHISPDVFTVVKNGNSSSIQKGIIDVHTKRGGRTNSKLV